MATLTATTTTVDAPHGGPLGKTAPHIIVEALAGTGKTFTVLEGVRHLLGCPTPGVKGTDQQEAIWKAMRAGTKPETVIFAAFNKSIALELQSKVPAGVQAKTLNSHGYGILKRSGLKARFEENKTCWLLEDLLGMDIREIRKTYKGWVDPLCNLVRLCKVNLVEFTGQNDEAVLETICTQYGIDIEEGHWDRTVCMVPRLLAASKQRTDMCDFADQLWLPTVLNLNWPKADLLVVDERQDSNRAQQELAIRSARRLVLCGDEHQAIYGFAGADLDACRRMNERLSASAIGCQIFPLTLTRRCCKAVVREAQALVPTLEALPEAEEGEVVRTAEDGAGLNLLKAVTPNDMVICRTNAPLVSYAMKLLRERRKAVIQGREIGKGLLNTLQELRAESVPELIGKLDDYFQAKIERLQRRKYSTEAQVMALTDTVECLRAFCDGAGTVRDVETAIEALFSDERNGTLFSSIHRAKGLEENRVFFIHEDNCPHPMARTDHAKAQEWNLRYVGITRAKRYLNLMRAPLKSIR